MGFQAERTPEHGIFGARQEFSMKVGLLYREKTACLTPLRWLVLIRKMLS